MTPKCGFCLMGAHKACDGFTERFVVIYGEQVQVPCECAHEAAEARREWDV